MYAEVNQLVMPETIPDSYWIEVVNHGIIPSGTRYLVVEQRANGWLLCWKDGIKPKFGGTLLHKEQVKCIE